MKLSEAILKGCKKSKQAYGYFMMNDEEGLSACALGAAFLSTFPDESTWSESNRYRQLREIYPCLKKENVRLKDVEKAYASEILEDQIIHMNDGLHLTREEIAAKLKAKGL